MARSRTSSAFEDEHGTDRAETKGTAVADLRSAGAVAAPDRAEDGLRMSEHPETVAAAAGAELEAVAPTAALQTGSDTLSRMIYNGSYALAYGVVYATVFVAQSLPQQNPLMHGFRDGGKAAVDELGAQSVDASPAMP
jgi:hypothetical protein